MHRRLSRFRVEGLFDLYTHDIRLNAVEHVTAIIGPNGIGKTICLKLINGLLNRKYLIFHSVQFAACIFDFDDGLSVRITKDKNLFGEDASRLNWEIRKTDGNLVSWTSNDIKPSRNALANIDRYVPFITRVAPDVWLDDRSGEALSLPELIERFGSQLPESITSLIVNDKSGELSDLLGSGKCHLVETQRLLVMNRDEQDSPPYRKKSTESTQLAVERKSKTLSLKIQNALTQYASLSQSLDRSFPRRILSGERFKALDEREIAGRLSELETRRQALEGAGILDPETEVLPQVPKKINNEIHRVISIYIDDTNQKLSIFDSLQRKIQLFEELISKRFIDKKLSINKNSGFVVRSNSGNTIPLDALSSGERHQLVLLFELLFETDVGDLVLIDEPELSLHVSWQKNFIDDLLRIIETSPFDAVLATHSPVLIGHHFDLSVNLERGDDEKFY